MTANTFRTFQEFETIADAEKAGQVLESHNIPVKIEKTPDLLDNVIIGRQYNNYVLLRIPAEHFEEAQKILIDNTEVDLDKVDRNYMLFSLSNEELVDVAAKPDEWGAYNYKLALLILKERNANIDKGKIESVRDAYISQLSAQRPLTATWMFFGYGFSIIGIAAILADSVKTLWAIVDIELLPCILGIILGLVIITTKKTLPDGTQIASYNTNARRHGWCMFLLSLAVLILVLRRLF